MEPCPGWEESATIFPLASGSVAEPDFYIWGGQGVARATSGGPQTKTENVCVMCVTLAWRLSSVNDVLPTNTS